jgi:hypothetical protein
MQRREFIGIAAAGAVWPALAAERSPDAFATPRLLGFLGEERVRELGARYRELVPAENDIATLTRTMVEDGIASPAGARDVRGRINEQVQRDFAVGRTIRVHGWILSVTEARQCALRSLRRNASHGVIG